MPVARQGKERTTSSARSASVALRRLDSASSTCSPSSVPSVGGGGQNIIWLTLEKLQHQNMLTSRGGALTHPVCGARRWTKPSGSGSLSPMPQRIYGVRVACKIGQQQYRAASLSPQMVRSQASLQQPQWRRRAASSPEAETAGINNSIG
eukprot:SAG11_NODE_5576_length_1519_cov_1.973944_2_plen_150_part_00